MYNALQSCIMIILFFTTVNTATIISFSGTAHHEKSNTKCTMGVVWVLMRLSAFSFVLSNWEALLGLRSGNFPWRIFHVFALRLFALAVYSGSLSVCSVLSEQFCSTWLNLNIECTSIIVSLSRSGRYHILQVKVTMSESYMFLASSIINHRNMCRIPPVADGGPSRW